MPRVVADTNVYISALNFAGRADDVLALARAGVIEMYVSPAIIDEIAGVLARKFGWSAPRIREATRAINDFTVLVHPTQPVNLVHEDEADNRILECALAARADTIITGDHHLLRLRRFRATRITTPREFLDTEDRR
ncbi:MAG: putative toxin-antitoxin system toxin component, PIN family [Candidatus Rokuibacteriota bacterium]